MAASDLVVAFTGASGSPYGLRLVEVLLRAGRTVHLTISPAAVEVLETESGRTVALAPGAFDPAALLGARGNGLDLSQLRYHHFRDFRAGIASGSFLTGGMAICPCSLGTLAAVAHGVSENVIHRAADVHLKERRKLVLVPRETPLGLIALRNMVTVTEAGAVVLPAMPAFYTRPERIEDMVDFVVGRVCDQLGVAHGLVRRWGETGGE
ncbi:putative aromatic acid decarboxylase [Gemmata obscuriglobus]|uniref:Flavin prenyltransferase UbiX n=1 Tax=Gemmata obscuriglobus TaxID=114 RepID=A0A2Z3HBI2_9BACT|nr:flavin prenyltransferase UbiX [Gemmata obscuriglobus]AWM38580.1 UbiX family flavin prenyltransferase [Gemmata obscuriglobus]QEG28463.1 putative aromatic acid decarboxylase [Gemmata obscuriglobus]VTS06464.1 3-octaprenyl-4-hydroxybenzoate carboxy-lyase : 3-octaprenyl-4-hydroxybenzoate carboxy-lyase OS=Planctomyces limnophilus (strain ATCC 43296 / DSM 3776 / IFAM 1008 / 290) GN=Plim_2148 PE=4 SV=1: Flavoprotein [Gemmata obscuriglobus UQM 2246]